jgi:hypothetical protein
MSFALKAAQPAAPSTTGNASGRARKAPDTSPRSARPIIVERPQRGQRCPVTMRNGHMVGKSRSAVTTA